MGSRDDQLQTIAVDNGAPPDGGGRDGPPSLWLVGSLLLGAILVLLGVSRSGPPPPTTVPPVPDIETTTTTTTLPAPDTAFDAESALTWSPASGLTDITHIRSATRLGQVWYAAADTANGSALYASASGTRWDHLPVPTGPTGEAAQISYLVRVGTNLAAVGKYVEAGGSEIGTVWWSTDAQDWTMTALPLTEPTDTPPDTKSTVEVTGAARAGGNLVVTANVAFTTVTRPVTARAGSEAGIPTWVPSEWDSLLQSSDVSPLSMSSEGVALVLEPFVVDYRTWEQLGVTYYRSSSYEMWVGYASEPMKSVPSPGTGFRPLGARPDNGTGYGLSSTSRLMVSTDGTRWTDSPTGFDSRVQSVAPWQNGWVRAASSSVLTDSFDNRIEYSPGSGWSTITPSGFLGQDWHLADIETSDLGIAGLAIGFRPATEYGRLGVLQQETADDGSVLYTIDPGAGTLSVATDEGGAVTFDLSRGDTTYVSPEGDSTLIPTIYPQLTERPTDSVTLRGADLIFGDGNGHELGTMPASRWTATWDALTSGRAFMPNMALVHSPDGVHWSARRGSGIAGPLAEGIDSLALTDDFVLVRLIGQDTPPVWMGWGRPSMYR